jgi:hypothetical protein
MPSSLRACILILLFVLTSSAHALSWRGITLDPEETIRPELLSVALASYAQHERTNLSERAIAIVDFSRPSSERRLHVLDLANGMVQSFLVAHGRGSDPDHDALATVFSDAVGSHASSLGAYRAVAPYQGAHGLSLSLQGLDPSNRSAQQRAVVLHSQWYVSDRMLAQHGKLGRSWGCFVVDPAVIGDLVGRLRNGGFIYAGR